MFDARFVFQTATVLFTLFIATTVGASEADKRACVDYDATQELRLAGKLLAARERAQSCAAARCPEVVRDGCTKWLTEIADAIPSVAVVAKGPEGRDVTAVSVHADGALIAKQLSGRAIELDPGPHRLRFEHADAPAVELQVVLPEGVKLRPVEVIFASEPSPAEALDLPPEPVVASTPVPAGAIALATIGGAALTGFAVLAGVGTAEVDHLRDSCGAIGCSEEQVRSARTKILAGDVLLGVGATASVFGIGWMIIHYATDDESSEEPDALPVRVDAGPTRGGGAAALTLTF